jgi:hypothetical protein
MNRHTILRGPLVLAIAATLSGAVPALGVPALTVPVLAASQPSMATTAAIDSTVSCTPGTRACPIRIAFASGAYSGQSHARMAGIHSARWFVVKARAGQRMIVIVKGAGPTRGVVYFPSGHAEGQPGGRVFDGRLPSTGDYRIRVTESSMGEGWSGRVDVLVVIY